MASVNLNVKLDSNIKKEAEKVLGDLGLNMSSAVNCFLRQVIRTQALPFSLSLQVGESKFSVGGEVTPDKDEEAPKAAEEAPAAEAEK